MSQSYPGKTIIGLTGNIAVGKSLVMNMLADLGATAINADALAHEVILRGETAFDAIIAAFGPHILGADGEIDRAALGRIVFAHPTRLKQLETITHPAIGQRIDQLIRDAESDLVVIEAIKLLEGRWRNVVDAVWVVDASPPTQLLRLQESRGLSEAEARQRINAQNKQADKLRLADVIISNDGTVAATRAQVQRAWRELK